MYRLFVLPFTFLVKTVDACFSPLAHLQLTFPQVVLIVVIEPCKTGPKFFSCSIFVFRRLSNTPIDRFSIFSSFFCCSLGLKDIYNIVLRIRFTTKKSKTKKKIDFFIFQGEIARRIYDSEELHTKKDISTQNIKSFNAKGTIDANVYVIRIGLFIVVDLLCLCQGKILYHISLYYLLKIFRNQVP